MLFTPWLRSLKFPARLTRTARRRKRRFSPLFAVERLEDRTLLSVFAVNSVLDKVDLNPGDGFVDTGTPGEITLRAAIQEANALAGADTITLGAGTFTLSIAGFGEDAAATGDLDITDNLTITGAGAGTTIIDAGGLDRVLHVLPGAIVDLFSVTIRNGSEFTGGAIFNSGTLTITDSKVSDSSVIGNDRRGGGIYNSGGALTITNTTVSGNSGGKFLRGGGIYNSGGALTISNSTFSANSAGGDKFGGAGGGIYNEFGPLTITNSTFSDNSGVNGGGILNEFGPLTITNSTFSGNSGVNGGAIGNLGGALTISNSTFSGNSDFSIENEFGTVTITNSTLTANDAGISTGFGTVNVKNTIIAGNIAIDINGAFNSLGNNLIGVNPLLGPLQDNGGPTFTHALLAGSPAIDAGDNTGAPATDQRGFPRIVDGDLDGIATIDIGAFEFLPPVGPVNVAPDVVLPATDPTPVASGSEFVVNTITSGVQVNTKMTALEGGGFVVIWDDISGADGSGIGVFGRVYDASGAPLAAQFLVNATVQAGEQARGSVAALAGGGFVITWDSQTPTVFDVFGRIYDAAGTPIGSEFPVNTTTAGFQNSSISNGLPGGGFITVWSSSPQDGSGPGIFGQLFDATGTKIGLEFQVNTFITGNQGEGGIAATVLNDGGFVVTWDSPQDDGGSSRGVYGQRYDASGTPAGSEFHVNTTTAGVQASPTVAALDNGGFVITWHGPDANLNGVYGQRYDVSGSPVGSEFQINTFTTNHQSNPWVTGLTDGGFLVMWTSVSQDGSGQAIVGQRYDTNGVAAGSEFQANTFTSNNQQLGRVVQLADGSVMASWTSIGQDGDQGGIVGQRFDLPAGNVTTDEDVPVTISGVIVSDIDAGTDPIAMSLSVYDGSLALTNTTGLTFSDADGSDGTLAFTGSQTDITAAFALSIVYTPDQDFYGSDTLTITANDQDNNGSGGALQDTEQLTITVNAVNDAPTVAAAAASVTVDESQTAANSGTFADVDASDNVVITASAGSITQDIGNSGNWSWSFDTSDGPDDSQTVTITATDSDGASSTTSFALTVNNVAPTLSNVGLTSPINENDFATLTGTITDPGILDTFELVVDWGEGSPETFNLAAGTTSFAVTHQYLDDNPSGTPSDVYTLAVTVTDDDGASATAGGPAGLSFENAIGIGATGNDMAFDVATDAAGNVYVTGFFTGTADFDPGPGTFNLTSSSKGEPFLAKYSPTGALIWAVDFNSSGQGHNNIGVSVAIDSQGDVYMGGLFHGTMDTDPGPGVNNLSTTAFLGSGFLVKLDSGGNFIWSHQLQLHSPISSVAVDAADNLYYSFSAHRGATIDVDPGPGTVLITAPAGTGPQRTYVVKVDSSGDLVWVRGAGGNGDGAVLHSLITVDGLGNVYTTGGFDSTVDFDAGVDTANLTSSGGTDGFVWKLDSSGNYLWARNIGGAGFDIGYQTAIDGAGNVYTVGQFSSSVDFDTGPGTAVVSSHGGVDAFVQKLDATGDFVWVRSYGSSDQDWLQGIAIDANGQLIMTGAFAQTVDFDPGAGVSSQTSAGQHDVAVWQLDSDGNFVSAVAAGGPGDDAGYKLVADAGRVVVVGRFQNTSDFEPGAGSTNLSSLGGNDAFVWSLANTGGGPSVTVTNVGPDFHVGPDEALPSGSGAFSRSGITFTDPGTLDVHTVKVDYDGDAIIDQTITVPLGDRAFDLSHTYTSSGTFTVSVTVDDDDTGTLTDTFDVTVVLNTPPVANDDSVTTNEDAGDTVINVLANDTDEQNNIDPTLTVLVPPTVIVGNLTNNGDGTFTYNPNGQFESLAVGESATESFIYQIEDTFGETDTATVTITVNGVNDAPTVAVAAASVTVDESQTAANSGTFADVDASDNVVITASAGSITQDIGNSGNWSWSFDTSDGPDDSQTVTITATDSGGASSTTSFALTVNNVAPTLSNVGITSPINENDFATLTGTITDPGTLDTFELVVDWGEGSPETFNLAAGTTSFAVTHQYLDDNPSGTPQDNYAIDVTVNDDDGGIGTLPVGTGGLELDFAFSLGSTGTPWEFTNDVITDAAGNIYVAGYFTNTVDFDPGPGTFNLTGAGLAEPFVAKYSAGGSLIWAKDFNSSGHSHPNGANSLALDSLGNLYVGGLFHGTMDSDPGPAVVNLNTSSSLGAGFLLKLDSAGDFVWSHQLTLHSPIHSVVVDASDNLYYAFSAHRNATIDVDPSAGVFNVLAPPGTGPQRSFVVKVNSGGTLDWVRSAGGFGQGAVNSPYLAVDGSGNVYITGSFDSTVDFDPGGGTTNLASAGGTDTYVWKLDSTGNFVWAKNMGGTSNDNGFDIALDSTGNVYTVGKFEGTADFDPGPATANMTSAGSGDAFAVKLDSSGNFAWAKSFGGSSYDALKGVTVDQAGQLFATGIFQQTVDFDPGGSVFNLTSGGGGDIAVWQLDSNGGFLNAVSAGGTGSDEGNKIAVDSNGDVLVGGWFNGLVDFDPTVGTSNLTSNGGNDGLLWKLAATSASPTVTVKNVAPELQNVSVTPMIDENGTATLSGDVVDPGTLDTFTLDIDWGDPLSPGNVEQYSFAAGTTSFSLSHQYLDDNPTGDPSNNYTIGLTVADDDTGSSSSSTSVSVNNVAPTANVGADQTVNEGDLVSLDGSFTDPGTNDTHTFLWQVSADNGQVIADGTAEDFSFTPFDNGTYTLTYTVTDDDGGVGTDTVVITVDNVAPVANADTATTAEDTAIVIDVLANDTDVGGDDNPSNFSLDSASIISTAGLSGVSTAPAGSLSIVGNQLQFDPGTAFDELDAGDSSTVTIDYTMSDDSGAPSSSTLTITVNGANNAPLAVADSGSTGENSSVTLDVLANDIDVDGDDDPSNFSLDSASIISTAGLSVSTAAAGSVSIVGNQLQFNPGTAFDELDAGDSSTVTIDYTMSDDSGAPSSSTLTITVNGANNAPLAVADSGSTGENSSVTLDVLANDIDVDGDDDPSNFSLDSASIISTAGLSGSPVAAGSVSIVGNQLQFDPGTAFDELDAGDSSTVTIDYTMSDDSGAPSSSTLTITVNGANDQPFLVNAIADVEANEDDPDEVIDVSSTFDDVDVDDTLTLSVSGNTNVSLVSATIVGGNLVLDYLPDQSGTGDITIRATDSGGLFVEDTFTVTVLSAQEQMELIQQDVQDLVAADVLNGGQGNSLTTKLDAATGSLDSGKITTGVNQLNALINQINAFIKTGKLSESDGQALIDAINDAIQSASSTSGAGLIEAASQTSTSLDGAPAARADELLTGAVGVFLDDAAATITADQQARFRDSIDTLNVAFGAYGVTLVEVAAAADAVIVIEVAATSEGGTAADGVLGYTVAGHITLLSGWNWYAGADPLLIGSDQYDLQTIVTHELGHSAGLAHSGDGDSVMYRMLATSETRRSVTATDLTLLEAEAASTPQPLLAAPRPDAQVNVQIADLSDSLLGIAALNIVWIDRDAAVYGWSVNSGGVDLFSAVNHEFGHVLGLGHQGGHDLMGATLGVVPGQLVSSSFRAARNRHDVSGSLYSFEMSARRRGARDEVFSRLAQTERRQRGAQRAANTTLRRLQAVGIDLAMTDMAGVSRIARRSRR